MRRLELLIVAGGLFWMVACGGGSGNGSTDLPTSSISAVVVTCNPASLQSGQQSQCSATVQGTGSYTSSVTWSATAGTISSVGIFIAEDVSSSTPVTITAASRQDPSKQGTTTITVMPAATISYVSLSCVPNLIRTGEQSQCAATVNGTGNVSQSVTWSGRTDTSQGLDCQCVSGAGVLTGPVVPGMATVWVQATSTQDASKTGFYPVTVASPGTISSVTPSCAKTTITTVQDSLCTAVVTGTGGFSSNVTWTVSLGDIFPDGLYLPYQVQPPAAITVTATSVQDNSAQGQVTINVTSVLRERTTAPNHRPRVG